MKDLTEFQMVEAMNKAFGNPRIDPSMFVPIVTPAGLKGPDDAAWAKVHRQLSNALDEINELKKALIDNEINDVRDALCDIRVFVLGGAHFLGGHFDDEGAPKIYDQAPIPSLLAGLPPIMALKVCHTTMMNAVRERDYHKLLMTIRLMLWMVHTVSDNLGIFPSQQYLDMKAVINGVMTRFIKDEEDLNATMRKFEDKGVETFYTEGEYPTMILKSAGDYPDAPKGKFLKAVSYCDTVFSPLENAEEVAAMVALQSPE